MIVGLDCGDMVGGFFGEDFCKFRELFKEDNRGFCLLYSGSKFHGSGKSGHHWGSQDKVGISLNNPMEGLISFDLGNELVFGFVV